MNKRKALVLSLGIISLSLLTISYFDVPPEKKSVIIARVIDGDTFKTSDGQTIRLININTPEKNFFGSELSSNYLKTFENKTVFFESEGEDKYSRTLARVYSQDLKYLNLEIIRQGFASSFLVSDSEIGTFKDAEESAIKSSRGIWQKSEFAGCIKTKTDKNLERVVITNLCNTNMEGWKLKDESRKVYTFKNSLASPLILHSSSGIDNASDLFWGSSTDIWNNDRDSLYLFDKSGGLVHYESYGY